ncbi:hypothetical protein GG344DRAFT_64536 [Lentinula edodes]|nr:hypothetical protein GG344DRAFT_64536 [Lentinula edodes]
MAQAATLDNTMGAMFIGVLFAAVLYGAACIQTWYYYIHQKDRWPLRFLVAAVMIVDTLHQALIAHTVSWLIESGNVERLTNFATFLLVAAEFVSVFVFGVIGLTRVHTFVELSDILKAKPFNYISGLLTLLLHTSRTGFQRSDSIINKLIIFSINTGALTSLCAIASMLSILLAPATFIYISFFFCMGRLYANSLLATLNIRTLIRKEGGSNVQASGDTGSIPLGNYNTSIFNPPSTISVKIDTSREYTTDREREQKRTTDFEDLSSRMNLP